MKTIGERIKNRRTELNITQDELAKKLGYKSRSSINKIELGMHNLTQSKIMDFAVALETTPGYIMGWEEKNDYVDEGKVREYVKLLLKLPAGKQKIVTDLIASLSDDGLSTTQK